MTQINYDAALKELQLRQTCGAVPTRDAAADFTKL